MVGVCGTAALLLGGCGADCNDPCGLGPPKGALRVVSEPEGATIYVDGKSDGWTTPTTLALLPGPHAVRVVRSGYAAVPDSFLVDVVGNDTVDALFLLEETGAGRIEVLSDPAGATILFDGVLTGAATPDTLEGVEPGAHVIRVSLAGFAAAPESALVHVAVDSISSASFQLSELTKRLVLVEHFSNTACDPCYPVEVSLALAIEALGFGTVVTVGNHLYYPAPNDLFYLANSAQLRQRERRLGVMTMPYMRINGVKFDDGDDYDALLAELLDAAEEPPYFAIDVYAEVGFDSIVVSGSVRKVQSTPEGDEVLVVAIIETDIDYDAANGLTHFDDILRRFLPGTSGQAFTGGVGETVPYRFAEALSGSWNAENLEAVVFLESNSTKRVFQAGSTRTLGKPYRLERKDGRR